MNFYLINQDIELISEMEDAGVAGNLFTYHTGETDFFTKIARYINPRQKIKYMVAIRPHVLSPEYLVRIHKSIKEISKEDRLQINLIAGDIGHNSKEKEIEWTLGPITNKSTTKERSNYLIEYIDLLNKLPQNKKPDYYISISNEFLLEASLKHNAKMLIPWGQEIYNKIDLPYDKVMISLAPVIRKTQEELENLTEYNLEEIKNVRFTYETLTNLVNKFKDQGIKEIIFGARNNEDVKRSIEFVKEYNYSKGKN
jgi:hypothetical protein